MQNSTVKTQVSDLYSVIENDNYMAFFNQPTTEVKLTFKHIDVKTRTAVLDITLRNKHEGQTYKYDYTIEARITKSLMYWFTQQTPVKDKDGQLTTGFATGYQKYLMSLGMPKSTKLYSMEFNSTSHSEDYKQNPFRLSVSRDYKSATLYNVREFGYEKRSSCDPATGEITERWFQRTDKETGQKLRLNPKHYRRIQIR